MNFERRPDMLAWQWSIGDCDYEFMLSLELGRWALPLGFEYVGYSGGSSGYTCVCRHWSIRLLCGAIHFSRDKTFAQTVSGGE